MPTSPRPGCSVLRPSFSQFLLTLALAVGGSLSIPTGAYCQAADTAALRKGDFGLGLNYPGVGARYFLTNRYSLEAKAQVAADISVFGLRGYRYFSPTSGIVPLAGIELDYLSFKGSRSKGSGFAAEVFVGGERFVSKKVSVQLDLGPAYISLSDDATSTAVSGLEYVVNFGINYYFID